MIILVTGSSSGIGKGIAIKFLDMGHSVIGFDVKESTISNRNYKHYIVDLKDKNTYPNLDCNINILINNAGVQNSIDDIDINLKGTISITEKYGFNKDIKSILFNISSGAHTGYEFPQYVASKSGLLGYMKNVACRLAKDYKATANSISLGGVYTSLNDPVVKDDTLFKKIMEVTPLKKWMSVEEVAEWVYFITVTNRSMSGQDIIIDNGERDLNNTFVWPEL